MARLVPIQSQRYSGLSRWVRDDLATIPVTKPTVWTAFLQHASIPEPLARSAISPDQEPVLFVEAMPADINGKFDPRFPRSVYLAERLVLPLAGPVADAQHLHLVESTVLHELVHWAWRERREPREMGAAFEEAAYGNVRVLEPQLLSAQVPKNLGDLSRRYESRGLPAAIGYDTNGGWSFGLYQIASNTGAMGSYLRFLRRDGRFLPFAGALDAAGGESAARRGELNFQTTWKRLAEDAEFSRAQHDFIQSTHYDPFVRKVRDDTQGGLDVTKRSHALNDVAWSISVQHGSAATNLMTLPWSSLSSGERHNDRKLIERVYAERMRVDIYFKKSSAKVRAAVRARFEAELKDALAMLANEIDAVG